MNELIFDAIRRWAHFITVLICIILENELIFDAIRRWAQWYGLIVAVTTEDELIFDAIRRWALNISSFYNFCCCRMN